MKALIDKNISSTNLIKIKRNHSENIRDPFFYQLTNWLHLIKRWQRNSAHEGQLVFGKNSDNDQQEIVSVNDIPFVIPRQLVDYRQETPSNIETFERTKLLIHRMDEYLISKDDQNQSIKQNDENTSLGLRALALAADSIQKVSFREVLSVGDTLQDVARRMSREDLSNQLDKIDPITDFQEKHDLIEFDEALAQHHENLLKIQPTKPSDMLYLKFCLMLELQRDEYESCLRIFLHEIIFKFHLADFRLRCEIHIRKPIENELIIEKIVHDSHLKTNYSAQFILLSGDWIAQQDVELYIIMKIESLSINKYISSKFWDMTHLHIKNIPHGSSRIFLRELTPVSRPSKILSRGINVGQAEIEATYWSTKQQLSIRIVRISHSQAERLLRAPETYVEVIFQGPFSIYDIKRTKVADRSLNPIFDEEFLFELPDKTAISDITVDLIFLEKSTLSSNPMVLGVLTLSKHTDWFPVRKFWTDLEENPDITLKNSFLFEGNGDTD